MMDRKFTAVFFVFNFLSNIKGIMSIIVYGFMIDALAKFAVQGFNSTSAWQAFGVYSGYHLAEGILEMFEQRYISEKRVAMESMLKRAYLHKLLRLDLGKLDKSINNEKLTLGYTNSAAIYTHYVRSISFLSDAVAGLLLLLIIGYFAWPLAVILLVLMVPRFLIDKTMRKRYLMAQKRSAGISRRLRMVVSMWLDRGYIRQMNAQKTVRLFDQKYVDLQEKYRNLVGKTYKQWQSITKILDMVGGMVSIMGFAWVLFRNSRLSAVGSIYIQLRLIILLESKLKKLVTNYNALEESCASVVDVEKSFGWDENTDNSTLSIEGGEVNEIEIRDVSMVRQESNDQSVSGVSMKIVPGEKTDFIVKDPIYKDWFAKVITKQIKPVTGEVLVNGLQVKDLAGTVMICTQNTYIPFMSVEENIVMEQNYDVERLNNVLENVGLLQTIMNMPGRTAQVLADLPMPVNADAISRLLLARVLYARPEWVIWIASAIVGFKTEVEIFNILYKEVKTVITVSERLTSSKNAHKVVLIKQGKVMEAGSPQDLMNSGGEYATLMQRLMTPTAAK